MNQERRKNIVELLEQRGTITNSELMENFNISIETVRRDLAFLEKEGFLERVYGGAVKKRFMNAEPDYANREKENSAEKNAIAKETEKLLKVNDTVFFDVGTTVLLLARFLDKKKDIKAFTNSLRTAIVLSEKGFDVILPGGNLRSGEFSVSGSIAENNFSLFNIETAIIGAAGITEDGITDFIPEEAGLRQKAINNANKVIVVADYSKFGIRAMCNICKISDIDVLVTDDKAPKTLLLRIEKMGVKVIIAKK